MTTKLSDAEANALIKRVCTDCVNHMLDMRDMGASPADMMTCLTRTNAAVMAYVLVSAGSRLNEGSIVRVMAKQIREGLPEIVQQYRDALEKGKQL